MLKIFGLLSGYRLQRKDTFFQYSTEEQFTGEYDYRGKKIYSKTFVKSVESSVGAIKTVDFSTGIINGERGWRDDSHSYYVFVNGNSDNLNMYNNPDRRFDAYFKDNNLNTYRIDFRGIGAGTCVLTIRYTKK